MKICLLIYLFICQKTNDFTGIFKLCLIDHALDDWIPASRMPTSTLKLSSLILFVSYASIHFLLPRTHFFMISTIDN